MALTAMLTPSGQIVLDAGRRGPGGSRRRTPRTQRRIAEAFARGRGFGVLQLGASELDATLDPTLAFWRDLGQQLVAKVCSSLDPTAPSTFVSAEADPEELARLAQAVPPMRGAELVTPALLAEVWADALAALVDEAAEHEQGVQGYLQEHSSAWNVVGRVCFHVAENRRDRHYPFAFIATYADKVSDRAKPRHLPLRRALEEYAGAGNRERLVALLAPLSRAAERSALIRQLVDSEAIYQPLAWTTREAHAFLREVPAYEQSGVLVRVPDWWRTRRRPCVSVTIGTAAPEQLGMAASLDFDVSLQLDGRALSRNEIKALLAAKESLVQVKGGWVEVDHEKLGAVLDQWRDVQTLAEAGEVGFGQAMRMLAGADHGAIGDHQALEDAHEWSSVVAGEWLASTLETLRAPKVCAEVEAGAGLDAELRPYQKYGIQWLWNLRALEQGGCLADDMGLGKTIQVLGVLSMARDETPRGTDLLVVPASLIDNWCQEAERFAPQLKLLVAHPSSMPAAELRALSTEDVEAHDAVITSYGTVTRVARMREIPWRNVILDEAQNIKNPDAQQTRAVKELSSRWRIALTGTPVENRLGDLWSIFDFLNPGLLGSAEDFSAWCDALTEREHNAYAPLRKLVQPYILRRLKTDERIISDLPDKTEVRGYCLLTERQAALYQEAVDEMRAALEEKRGIERRGVVLAALMRFKQICNHPSQWLGDGDYGAAESGKFRRLAELCEPIVARQDKLLVFTQFREMTEPLAAHLAEVFGRPGLVLHGGTPVKRRQRLVETFQEDESAPFMVLSLKAGGTGLNLTAASHVVHFDRWWNPAVENQATDRAFRIGQHRNVLVHKFVCRGTVEERIDEMIESKQQLSDEILEGGAEQALTELSDEALMQMVALDVNTAVPA